MKSINTLILFAVCLFSSANLSPLESFILNLENSQPKIQSSIDDFNPQGRGCCSWHGGVCGCSGRRATCCDGTVSPSCGC